MFHAVGGPGPVAAACACGSVPEARPCTPDSAVSQSRLPVAQWSGSSGEKCPTDRLQPLIISLFNGPFFSWLCRLLHFTIIIYQLTLIFIINSYSSQTADHIMFTFHRVVNLSSCTQGMYGVARAHSVARGRAGSPPG